MRANPNLPKSTSSLRKGILTAETILEKLAAAGVSTRYYYTNAPLITTYGTDRMAPFINTLDRYFADAAAGTLPNVSFLDPQFGGQLATDDHPNHDVGLGQRWVREMIRAFVESPQWQRGALVVTYDENGGFFDHVRPPLLADARASKDDNWNFAQAGFRVPTFVVSPFAMAGGVDHEQYDHTSILRFLEWRFLGAPAQGTGGGKWSLTLRDRSAANMGRTLRATNPDPVLGFDIGMKMPAPSPDCTATQVAARPTTSPTTAPAATAAPADGFDDPELDDFASAFPHSTHRPWLADVKL
jgi:phospholipase C